ncbi:MAG: flavodoxin-dependent (E)-4-hydroxy-3-methylbut-2-enyl-diphosphate synthase, partial [Verrucomicrobiota bacterium]|nr:flavodoxin-dependent (E)-4-hydroxy-3-methylbut-2-enyl-diphosphate synthase [Verrucomicrobiota bacterium]
MDRIGVLAVANGIQPMVRWRTRRVDVGNLGMGGDEPVRVQSMTNTDTMNQQATVEQSIRLVEAGCELVRITAPSVRAAAALGPIRQELRRRGVDTPLSADIHFLPEAAH